jgi:hypothetical protein
MFYVNGEFCKTTEYSKARARHAQGRNCRSRCRFLQGPETEPKPVEVICETLRQGIDCHCHVELTNYKKSGKKFQNLLSMHPECATRTACTALRLMCSSR